MAIELDVRDLVPRDRHTRIFEALDGLQPGETLRLINDHDPVPLLYQLEAERPEHFRWDYIEQGPERWVVDITSRARVFDARPILRSGGEPFSAIMEAVSQVSDDEIFVLYAPFEPVPLEGVLAEQGFRHVADKIGEDDWRVIFLRQ